uniref:Uncharacterized protein n=1 Tax=Oryza nivara TaxID=4536 RepID=A0A0E0GFK4_ORYNI
MIYKLEKEYCGTNHHRAENFPSASERHHKPPPFMNTFKDAIDALLPAAGTRPVTDAPVPVRDSPSPRPYRLLHHPYHLPAAAPCPLSASWAARWAAAAATKLGCYSL